jgi:hypothetical protein
MEGTFFYSMLSSGVWLPNEKGEYFIDRDYEGFERILNYLSTGNLSFKGLNDYEKDVLISNLDYFQITYTPTSKTVRWSSVNLPSNCTLSNNDRSVYCVGKDEDDSEDDDDIFDDDDDDDIKFRRVLATTAADRFKVSVHNAKILMGFCVDPPCGWKDDKGTQYTSVSRWYLCMENGNFVIQHDYQYTFTQHVEFIIRPGSTIAAIHSRETREIRFEIDDKQIGVCFNDIPDKGLIPFIGILPNLLVTLI